MLRSAGGGKMILGGGAIADGESPIEDFGEGLRALGGIGGRRGTGAVGLVPVTVARITAKAELPG